MANLTIRTKGTKVTITNQGLKVEVWLPVKKELGEVHFNDPNPPQDFKMTIYNGRYYIITTNYAKFCDIKFTDDLINQTAWEGYDLKLKCKLYYADKLKEVLYNKF